MGISQNHSKHPTTWRSGRIAVAFVVALGLALIAVAYVFFKMPYEVAYENRTEDGVLEKITVWFFWLALLACMAVVIRRRWVGGCYVAVILLACILRELDFHIRPTTADRMEKINSTRWWRSVDVGLIEKLVVAMVFIAILTALWKLVRGSGRRWFEDLKRGRPYAISVAGMLLFVAVAYILDNRLDMDALDKRQDRLVLLLSLVEESIEVGVPLLMGLATVQWAMADARHPSLADVVTADE
ncbi:MAG: hypothetical protein ACI9UA_004085 [Pseudoalteromonas tetraodonis]|jgi:glucan phosphoethanolaminetransferase (alkaline phosphatase superfamily)